MTPVLSPPKRAGSPRTARPASHRHSTGSTLRHSIAIDANSPIKKRKYIPGGPGGGGRYVDVDGTETPVGGTGPGGAHYTGPRGRVGRENSVNGTPPPQPQPRPREKVAVARPRYSSAAATAAAVVQGDGFKPREERGWEEFHPNLDLDSKFQVYAADLVDGIGSAPQFSLGLPRSPSREESFTIVSSPANDDNTADIPATMRLVGHSNATSGLVNGQLSAASQVLDEAFTPIKRRPGRPFRRTEMALNGNGTPIAPKVTPISAQNPREKLTLPKPSFRLVDTFSSFERKAAGQQRYVDRAMANVGYQESDIFIRQDRKHIRYLEGSIEEDLELGPLHKADGDVNTALGSIGVGRVEYDMDEQDDKWLAAYNAQRKLIQIEPISREIFEITMTKIEKEWHALEKRIPKPNPKPPQTHRPRSSSAAAVNGELTGAGGDEQDSKCAICDDGDCENTNAIVFCDGCDLAVHQECYGVPFIPEGQWLCRKCQLIGRGTPTCIFCPNIDGAFKQTNSSRWSHLLCAIWIPEVTLGNSIFMEPVMDVEKVPKPRWKLTCYICRQRMGACIQCGNKNCFVAFHVTCARRSRLFLKMKTSHGGPANLDASLLKAYCDRHVPSEWRRENDVDGAIADAQEFYHHTMRGKLWADSQQSALAVVSSYSQIDSFSTEEPTPSRAQTGSNKRKRNQQPKPIWRLPSGAPLIPQIVYTTVESSLQRFMIRKRREYAAEACKYWTLKREVRRGAALLKRLQLQMETYSSMEITRRNFAGMGAAGRVRLERRVEFSQHLLGDLENLRQLCNLVKFRELEKLKEAEMLRDIVDTVYFPITPLLWPILDRAQNLDPKGVFKEGLSVLKSRLDNRFYTSVSTFSTDLGVVFSASIGLNVIDGNFGVGLDLNSTPSNLVTQEQHQSENKLTADQKDKRRLAKRIIKAIQSSLEEATRKEAQLGGKPFEKELKALDIFLENSLQLQRRSIAPSLGEEQSEDGKVEKLSQSRIPTTGNPDILPEEFTVANSKQRAEHMSSKEGSSDQMRSSQGITTQHVSSILPIGLDTIESVLSTFESQTPHFEKDLLAPLSYGGIPWYLEPFDPVGTIIHEERWTGREVLRGMSEELSELDEEELRGLVDDEAEKRGPVISANNFPPGSVS
ncbi:MAG: nuA3 HAT complex component nto1 [Trizodia sp. TS-e1964]|nr:MAG: nuA3 HAT complex component nto1 [Trizodia sp. TS-e1964]